MMRKFYNISQVKVQTKPRIKDKGIKLSKLMNKPVNVGFREVESRVYDQLRRSRKLEYNYSLSHYKKYFNIVLR